jgi:hypothetical protein
VFLKYSLAANPPSLAALEALGGVNAFASQLGFGKIRGSELPVHEVIERRYRG